MKAIILARVSTEEQREAGNSLPAQQDRLRRYIDRNPSLELVKEFVFDESAYKAHRFEFEKVIAYIKAQKETIALCSDKIDRLSRDFLVGVVELEKLRRAGRVELHFASDGVTRIHQGSNAGEMMSYNMLLTGAQYYSHSISDNTKRAFEQKRRSGEWTGPVRIGYKNVPLDIEKRLRKDIVPDPERAHLIQKLFELYATGNYSITTLWQEMTRLGLRGLNGQVLARSNIELILKETFYFGIASSKKYGSYPHRYKCLITKELFDRCQSILHARRKRPSMETARPFIFKGLLTCANCGCLMSPEIKKGRFIYYSCTNAKRICKREYVPEKKLLEPIYDAFQAFKNIPQAVQERIVQELRTLNEGEVEFHRREVSRVHMEYQRVQVKINTLLDMRLDLSITLDEYDKKLQTLKDEQYRLDIQQNEYTKADHEYHIHVSTVFNLTRRIGEIFESSELSEKRAILNYILQNPTVSGKTLSFELKKPFNTVLELGLSLSQNGKRDSSESLSPVWLRG